jgi:hypothetical protein
VVSERDGDVVGRVPAEPLSCEQPLDRGSVDAEVLGERADGEIPVGGEPAPARVIVGLVVSALQ